MKKKVDITTLLGLAVALCGIGIGYLLEGGDFKALLAISPILIIFGGTFGVVIVTIPMYVLKNVPKITKAAFTETEFDYLQLIDDLCEWAKISQVKGIVALDEIVKDIEEPFILNGLDLVASNAEPEAVNDILDSDISMMEERHKQNAMVFGSAGGFAPTMGIIGTVLGLIVVLSGMEGSSMGELGHGIATAFLATFMGVASANLVFIPIETKLKAKTKDEVLFREIVKQGIIGIQEQESSIMLKKRLLSMLPASVRNQPRKEE